MSEKVKKPFYKKWWVWLIAIIVVIAVVSGGDEDNTEVASSEKEEESVDSDKVEAEETEEDDSKEEKQAKKDEEKEESIGIGDPAKVGDVIFTVNSVEETSEIKSGNEFIENATTSGKFIILNITVKNEKEEAITVDSSFFTLIDGDTSYEPTSDFEVMMALDENDDFFLTQINPNLDKTGDIAIEVSEDLDLSTAILEAQTGFFGTETVDISLSN